MAFLKFNKAELVNLSYSLKREIICVNKTGAYCNTSIVTCNTRRYHGLLSVTLDRFGGDKYLLLSAIDESIIVNGKQFNLGIHCYGDIYEPRGHKYVVDFGADPIPSITYKVGDIVFRKSLLLLPDSDRLLIKYELLESPGAAEVILKPFLAFRNIHALTGKNDEADQGYTPVENGAKFRMYANFPDLVLQLSSPSSQYNHNPEWYFGITYSDEYRRGFDCKEDLFVPGNFSLKMGKGDSVVLSASLKEENPSYFKRCFSRAFEKAPVIDNYRDLLARWANLFICNHNGHKRVTAGFSWMYTGLLRETLISLAGLTLYANGDTKTFEEVLDNLISDEQERLFRRTTQVEAPLLLVPTLQSYIAYGVSPSQVWKKYGVIVRGILESYLPGRRREVTMHPNGLLWAQMDNVALSWMNAYINGVPVTERAGYQVETNALWYNAICFAVDMEYKYGSAASFVKEWAPIRDLVKENFTKTFWNARRGCLADYVDNNGQNTDVRPNQLIALWVKNSPLDEELHPSVFKVVSGELETSRGIRTLSPRDIKYKNVYEGSQVDRDLAYHQGSTRPFLLEYYVAVGYRIIGPSFRKKAEWLCEGLYEDLSKHGVAAFSELYDGDPPQEPHGAIASALSTAALLAVDHITDIYSKEEKK
ncbi:MAG: amylo-alpha-1,6-glucosidase [Bacteroidales bacterium]|nr:amylo-alpha-1,6-glucosidase [Bacteroidales bacterium]